MSKVKRFSIWFVIVLTIRCALLGCNGGKDYLNGHRWGETENQTAGKGWDRTKFAGYEVQKVWTYHSEDGLYEVQYTFVVIDKDARDVYKQLKKALGDPDWSGNSVVGDPEYTWYQGTVSIEASLTEYQSDYANAHGERTVKVVVTIVNDKYR